jgi:hypothetical protein
MLITKVTTDTSNTRLGYCSLEIGGCEPVHVSDFEISIYTDFFDMYEHGNAKRIGRTPHPQHFEATFTIVEPSLKPEHLWFPSFMKDRFLDCRTKIIDFPEMALDGKLEIVGVDHMHPEYGAYKFKITGVCADPNTSPPAIKKPLPIFHQGRLVTERKKEPTPIKPKRKVSFD